jgi:hypothetical protein
MLKIRQVLQGTYDYTGRVLMQKKTGTRFMIDTATYRDMNPRQPDDPPPNRDDLGPEVRSQDDPDLGDSFYMCLPTTIFGFDMQKDYWGALPIY